MFQKGSGDSADVMKVKSHVSLGQLSMELVVLKSSSYKGRNLLGSQKLEHKASPFKCIHWLKKVGI